MAKLTEHMKQLIKQHPIVFVATSDFLGRPNVSPKGVLLILDDDMLIFADLFSQKTRTNLRANPYLALAVVDAQAYEGYQIKGRAELLKEGALYERVAELLARSTNRPQPMELWYEKTARGITAALGRSGRNYVRPAHAVVLHIEEIRNLAPGHEQEVWQ